MHRAERRRLKSSSGVQDVLLTSSFVFPVMISSACFAVSGNVLRKERRAEREEMGWNMAAGLSWRVKIGERML